MFHSTGGKRRHESEASEPRGKREKLERQRGLRRERKEENNVVSMRTTACPQSMHMRIDEDARMIG